ncbi:MAG: amidohydrolase family protein [bacterium]
MWKQTTKQKRNLKIFKEELDDFLPKKFLDFHIHICPKEAMQGDYDICGYKQKEYSIEQLRQDCKELYPDRECYGVCFGHPNRNRKYNFSKMNEYVSKVCDRKKFFPFRLLRPEDNPEVVEKAILEKGFLGFKPYLNYVNKPNPEDVEIKDMLPDRLMRIADKYGLIITLHIPKKKRLADPSNQKQIVHLCEKYANAKIVLAHVGRAYYLKNIIGNLDKIKKIPNLYFDLAMVNNWEVLEYLFVNVESHKILYGTDIPIALAGGKSVEINDQYTYVTPVPWELSISDDHQKLVFTSFAYEEIRAIKKAIKRLNLSRNFVEDIFFNNGMKLLKKSNE